MIGVLLLNQERYLKRVFDALTNFDFSTLTSVNDVLPGLCWHVSKLAHRPSKQLKLHQKLGPTSSEVPHHGRSFHPLASQVYRAVKCRMLVRYKHV